MSALSRAVVSNCYIVTLGQIKPTVFGGVGLLVVAQKSFDCLLDHWTGRNQDFSSQLIGLPEY